MLTINIISTALSPITHMHGVAGNVALLQREAVIDEGGGLHFVPCLSGNALRHVLVRTPAAQYMADAIGLDVMPYQLADLLWHGGRLTKANPLTAKETKELMGYIPFFALLGGALPGQILQGCLKVSRALLICSETAHIIEKQTGVHVESAQGAESFVGSYQYTRGAEENNPEAIADRMIYEGECVRVGAKFYHTLSLENPSRLAIGCLLRALYDASKDIGGMGRIGHGELHMEWHCAEIDDPYAYIKDYEEYIQKTAAIITERLLGLFDAPKAKDTPELGVMDDTPKEAKKSRKKAAEKADRLVKKEAVKQLKAQNVELDFFGAVPEA